MIEMKKIVLICIFLAVIITPLLGSSFEKKDVYEVYDKDGILEYFENTRRHEPVDEFQEKSDGIYLLTMNAYYQIGVNDDGSIRLKTIKSRKEYDSMVPFWLFIILFAFVGAAILAVIFIPQKPKHP